MIINTGCRTDIPAFYSKWLMNRIRVGKENDMVIHSCCEKTFLADYGIKCNGCMSQKIIEQSINYKLIPPKKKNLRIVPEESDIYV